MSFVSIIIPCRNEEALIKRCLDSLIEQDYPKDQLEILVVDGMSQDKTREIVKSISQSYPFVRLVDNVKKTTPFAMNLGIKSSKGDIVIILGAHAIYAKDYVSKSVMHLKESRCDNVGGHNKPLSRDDNIITKAVAAALRSPFGAGDAHYIIGSKKPREVDTVFGGCYKREVFEKIGLFNERLTRSQDMELNLRLKRAGGKIMLFPDIKSYYYPRKTSITDFTQHNFVNGMWAIYPLRIVSSALRLRHYLPLIFVSSLILSLILSLFNNLFFYLFLVIISLYLLTNIYFTITVSMKEKNLAFIFILPLIFAIRHMAYGLGSIYGVLTIWKIHPPKGLTP